MVQTTIRETTPNSSTTDVGTAGHFHEPRPNVCSSPRTQKDVRSNFTSLLVAKNAPDNRRLCHAKRVCELQLSKFNPEYRPNLN
jgi:hypothetical protein